MTKYNYLAYPSCGHWLRYCWGIATGIFNNSTIQVSTCSHAVINRVFNILRHVWNVETRMNATPNVANMSAVDEVHGSTPTSGNTSSSTLTVWEELSRVIYLTHTHTHTHTYTHTDTHTHICMYHFIRTLLSTYFIIQQ